jgi:hypothetical protein
MSSGFRSSCYWTDWGQYEKHHVIILYVRGRIYNSFAVGIIVQRNISISSTHAIQTMVDVSGIIIVCVRYYYKNMKAFKLYRSRYYEQNVTEQLCYSHLSAYHILSKIMFIY